ncbi:DNA-binding CsgD family transcriptional regulator [Hoeflea halophila]|uniref:DNA-binding CsgD family transcriptional regulator n=1 Tax=Hoeflea halophila TaxID=714899 RepID=A0A286HYI0_9HYPH|nr:LuxR family transcriptional regulator [Hoeflea halophila]SOE12920.1 DNA-binding CsgD family transcriptional regulator [Hoeflea halophila]
MTFTPNPALQTEPFELIGNVRTMFDAMQVLRKTCLSYGFLYFSVITLPIAQASEDNSIARMAMISSWPPELIAEYDRLGLARNSPVFDRLRKQITPVVFEIDAVNHARPDQEQAMAAELFRRFGLTVGVYFPVHDNHGLRHAVSFTGDRAALSVDELSALSMFATMLIEQISIINSTDDAAKSVLNARETEILKWTAEGKTSPEIAMLTGLSEHTVNHYATIATKKLGCSNRTQAVVYAIRLGLFK